MFVLFGELFDCDVLLKWQRAVETAHFAAELAVLIGGFGDEQDAPALLLGFGFDYLFLVVRDFEQLVEVFPEG
jgi:hypothetical protein